MKWKNGAVCLATRNPWGFSHVLHHLSLSLFSFFYIRSILPFIPRGCVTRAGGSREGGFEGDGYRSGGLRNPETGEVEKVVGTRARVTASNNVFSPLCVLAAREGADGQGVSRACHPHPRAGYYPTWDRACLYTLRNQFRQYRLLRTGHEGLEKGMKRGSPSRPRLPLILPLFLLELREKGCWWIFTFGRWCDAEIPRSFVSVFRSSFD